MTDPFLPPNPTSSPPPGPPPSIPPRDSYKRKPNSCDDLVHLRLIYSSSPDGHPFPLPLLPPLDPHHEADDGVSREGKRSRLDPTALAPSSNGLEGKELPSDDHRYALPSPDGLCSSSSSPPSFSFESSEKPPALLLPTPFPSTPPPSPYSNALSSLISAHLPPVLTDLVMTYFTAILPGLHHYAGHAYLDNNAYFRFSNDYRLAPTSPSPPSLSLSPPLRLDQRSFSWSGWMNRVSSADNQFLFSFSNPHLHIPPLLSNLHVGYRHYQIHSRHVDCFTFGFWCNDLDAKNAADVTATDQWEHWAGTFEYPVSSPLPSLASSLLSSFPSSLSLPSLSSPSLGHRSLYRNGRLVCADECPAFIGRHCELAVGNRLVSSTAREGLKGGICDVRIWSRVLSEEEVGRLWEGDERGVSRRGLEVWYKFDESEEGMEVEGEGEERGRLLLDHSGHGRHASLIMPNEIRQMKHSGMIEYPKLPAWEGQPH